MTLADLGRKSVRRNALIADMLHRIAFIEKAGTGIKRIRDEVREQGCPEPEFEVNGFFTAIFRPNPEVRAQAETQAALHVETQVGPQVPPKYPPSHDGPENSTAREYTGSTPAGGGNARSQALPPNRLESLGGGGNAGTDHPRQAAQPESTLSDNRGRTDGAAPERGEPGRHNQGPQHGSLTMAARRKRSASGPVRI